MNLGNNSPFFKYLPQSNVAGSDGYDYFCVTYPFDIDEFRLKMFRKDVYDYVEVRRIMNKLGYEYNIVQSPAAANRLVRNTLDLSVIDVYGFNDVLGNRYAQVLPEWTTRIIRRNLDGRATKRDRRTNTIINSFYDKSRTDKGGLEY